MPTALDIIKRSLRTIGVLASGETPSSEMANDALVSLNGLIQQLSNERLTIYANTQDTLTLDGSTSYTYGLTGDLNSARPTAITSCLYRDSSSNDYPVDVINTEQYAGLVDKDVTGNYPLYMYYNPTYPLGTIYLYQVPSSGTLVINTAKPLTEFTSLSTSLSMPNGYDRMLMLGLAMELSPEYGVQDPKVFQMFMDAKAWIKRINTKPKIAPIDLPFGNQRMRGNILTGGA